MRTILIGLGAVLGMSLFAPTAKAQDGGFSDPFFLYYGYFLPRQGALAAQGQPEDFYRQQSIQRQAGAQTDRAGLYDPTSTIGQDELDPLRAFGTRSGSTRMVGTTATGLRTTVSQRGHNAPREYYQRTASDATGHSYFPTLRSGFGARARSAPAVGGMAGQTANRFIPQANPYAGRGGQQ